MLEHVIWRLHRRKLLQSIIYGFVFLLREEFRICCKPAHVKLSQAGGFFNLIALDAFHFNRWDFSGLFPGRNVISWRAWRGPHTTLPGLEFHFSISQPFHSPPSQNSPASAQTFYSLFFFLKHKFRFLPFMLWRRRKKRKTPLINFIFISLTGKTANRGLGEAVGIGT